jgi:hypothetical protein
MQDVRRNQQLFTQVFLNALMDAVSTIRRAAVKFAWKQYRYGQSAIPTMVPTFTNTSVPTQNISRKLQNSELQFYEEDTYKNRQLQTSSSSLEQCLLKYTKIVQVVAQITVPLPKSITPADYALILENLLQDSNYIKLINKWATYYDVPIYLNVSTKICGYVTLKLEPSILPTSLPSSNPSSNPTSEPTSEPTSSPAVAPSLLPTINPIEEPSLAPALLPTINPIEEPSLAPALLPTNNPIEQPSLAPALLPTNNPIVEPSLSPALPPTFAPSLHPDQVPTAEPSSVAPTSIKPSLIPSTSTPSFIPSSTAPTQGPTSVIGE